MLPELGPFAFATFEINCHLVLELVETTIRAGRVPLAYGIAEAFLLLYPFLQELYISNEDTTLAVSNLKW